MLILSRRTNQRLFIGDSIEITVVEVRDGHVRLGINAPKNVAVYREELLDEVTAENRAAAAIGLLPNASLSVTIDTDQSLPSVVVLSPSGPALAK